MLTYVIRRLLIGIVQVAVITVVTFVVLRLLP
jgi:ABC-type dipeptide/oligopeptide/nickel transport system permease component